MKALLNEGVAQLTEETLVPPDPWSARFQRYRESGDLVAFQELYDYFYRYIFVIAARFFHDEHIAEDVVHEVWMKLLHTHTFDPHKPFLPWLKTAVYNQCVDHQRRTVRRTEGHESALGFDIPDDHDDLDATLVASEVWQIVASLPELQRSVLIRHSLQEECLNDIAKATETPEPTVRWRHGDAMKKFRHAYETLLHTGKIPHRFIAHE